MCCRRTIEIFHVHSRNISVMRYIGFFTKLMEKLCPNLLQKRLKCVKNIFLLHFFLAFLAVVIYPLYNFLGGSVLVYSFGGKILTNPAWPYANDLRKQQKWKSFQRLGRWQHSYTETHKGTCKRSNENQWGHKSARGSGYRSRGKSDRHYTAPWGACSCQGFRTRFGGSFPECKTAGL